jgi:hypothetical protein
MDRTESGLAVGLCAVRAMQYQILMNMSLLLSILCVVFLGMNITCWILSYMNNDAEVRVPFITFGCFAFVLVKILALQYSPKWFEGYFAGDVMTRCCVLLAVCLSTISTCLVFIDHQAFERPVHIVLCLNESSYLAFDMGILVSMSEYLRNTPQCKRWIVIFAIAVILCGAQLWLYLPLDTTAPDYQQRLKPSIDMAYVLQIISALITFSFCWDNKTTSEMELTKIISEKRGGLSGHNLGERLLA